MGHPLRVLIYDIETAPMDVRAWRPDQRFIQHGMVKDDIFMLTWAAKWWGRDEGIMSARVTTAEVKARDDRRIVEKLGGLLRRADVLLAHNGNTFDRPIVNGRIAQHGLEPIGPFQTIDTVKLARRELGYSHNNLDALARRWGIGQKIKTDWTLWERCIDGPDHAAALREMDEYCQHDVDVLDKVFTRMIPYVSRLTRLYEAISVMEDICLYCGSPEKERRGVYRTQSGNFPKFRCLGHLPDGSQCGKYRRGRNSSARQKAAGHPL